MSPLHAASRPLPWRIGDLLGLWAALVAASVILLLAWWGASSTVNQSDQIFWVNVGVAGVIVAGAGAVVWVLTGRRAVGERRLALLPNVAAHQPGAGAMGLAASDELVTATRMTRYHRGDCPLVAGKQITRATPGRARAAGLEPCGICRPNHPFSEH